MKFIYSFLTLLVTCHLLLVTCVQAHMIGQPPYFKVNGIFTDYYPVPSTSLADLNLPQDIAVGLFLVNRPVEFEIDVNALPVPAEIVEKTEFNWDFGDGTQGTGLKNSHSYSKPGTYFLNIYADSGTGAGPQLLQSTAINIVPDKDYKLPQSIIEINSKQAKDPLLDIVNVNFNEEINFSGGKSSGGSSQIIEYKWDLGDQNSKAEESFKYKYSENPYTVFPVLRVKTRDGFIADSFIQIKDENSFTESKGIMASLKTDEGLNWPLIIGGILLSLILAGILTWVISKFLSKK